MTAVALTGWLCAAASSAVAALAVARLRVQASRVARAAHELRGGLCVAGLALEASALDAVGLQLRRAGRALADLDRAAQAPEELFDLGGLLRAVAAGWSRVSVELGDGPLRVHGDRAALAQACTNLVANALEHGAPPVVVSGTVADGVARIEVADAGAGLPASVDALVASARRGRGRRGHGLAVAADVARRHAGRLGTAPTPDGARMVLEIPAVATPPTREPAS